MQNIEMTKIQKRIFIFILAATLLLAAFIIFVYMPAKMRLGKLKSEYVNTQGQIAEMKMAIGAGKKLEEVILSLKSKIKSLDSKFPDKEEIMLREIAELAKKDGLYITSMKPGKRAACQLAGVNVRDCILQEMSIGMELNATYKELGGFLADLKNNFTIFVRVDDVSMSKASADDTPLLTVSLSLYVYLLSPVNR